MRSTLVKLVVAGAGVVLAALGIGAAPVGASGDVDRGHMARMHADMVSESPEMARMHADMVSQDREMARMHAEMVSASPEMARMHAEMVSGRGGG